MRNWNTTVLVVFLGVFLGLLPAACSIDRRTPPPPAIDCANGAKDGDETDKDCGGSCPACDVGKPCLDSSMQAQNSACKGGRCVDGVCCDTDCSMPCWSCVSSKTGKPDGTCAPVKKVTDPDGDCAEGGTKTCELSGTCDGAGKCAVIGCSFSNGSGHCENNVCKFDGCGPDYADCDNDPSTNGCEAKTDTVDHCGSCKPCVVPNGTPTCENGQCGISSCTSPYDNCNGKSEDGCEANTQTDPMHCGECGNECTFANAVAGCQAGVCVIAFCNFGWGDCDGMKSTGCEHDVGDDVDNCGACGRACSGDHVASRSCSGGVCDSTCVLGYGNCNQPAGSTPDDGCETDVQVNDASCGGCGNDCGKQGGTGMSNFQCDAGNKVQKYCGCSSNGECDSDGNGPASGTCESFGLCKCAGTSCQPGEACAHDGQKSVCSCQANADGAGCGAGKTCCQTPAGCFDLGSDPKSCGACGRACPEGFVCFQGECACTVAADCDAGGGGTCDSGNGCSCPNEPPGNLCSPGARCQPDGKCG